MSVGIDGKVVAITGASSGIGEATAHLLARQGALVVLGTRGAARLETGTQSYRLRTSRTSSRRKRAS